MSETSPMVAFFCAAETASRVFTQRLVELKYELRLDIGDERALAPVVERT
ncbi:hypothetical protein ACFW1M_29120 [Streptomyces inhibens]